MANLEYDGGSVARSTSKGRVEVLSDSTERDDRIEKFALYRACPTVEEYVLIATRYQAVEVFRRAPGDWTTYIYLPGEVVELRSIAAQLAVSDLYRLTEVPAKRAPRPVAPAPHGQGAEVPAP